MAKVTKESLTSTPIISVSSAVDVSYDEDGYPPPTIISVASDRAAIALDVALKMLPPYTHVLLTDTLGELAIDGRGTQFAVVETNRAKVLKP